MKPVMKMYVEKGVILLGEESQVENNQMSKKDLPTYLMTEEKARWEKVAPRNQGEPKRPPENTKQ